MRKHAVLLLLGAALLIALLPAAPAEERPDPGAADFASDRVHNRTDHPAQIPPSLAHREPQYRLGPGDVFDLEFPLTPEFNQQAVAVQPDGYVSLRSVGQFQAAGQTVPELTEALRASYGKILHDPVITVILKDFDKSYFIVSGQVAHPGKFDLRGDLTVTQGVAMAGGLTMTAKHGQVLLFRRMANDWYEVKKVNVKRMLQAGNINEDVHLQPGDMLFVPTSLLGNVKRFVPGWALSTYVNPLP